MPAASAPAPPQPRSRARAGATPAFALGGLLILAAVVRFAGIGAQSLWLDEVVTAELMNKGFGDMLSTIPHSESTPYLYYVLLWPWAHVFGDGEAGLRSLSALFGIATVGAIWAGARALVGDRTALAAGALAALNPFLVWYSQEARAYALLALGCAVSFWLFARALRRPGNPRALAWWALASALAVATHYFAAFTVVPEGVALAVLAGRSRALYGSFAAIGLAGLALVPLAATQRRGGGADWIGDISLAHRTAEIPKRFVAGDFGNQLAYVFWPVLVLSLVALVLMLRARDGGQERRGAIVALAIGVAGLAIPIALAIVTLDYVFPRNLIGSLPVLLVGLAATTTGSRPRAAGTAILVGVLALSALALVQTATDSALQRDDWDSINADLDAHAARVVVVSPGQDVRALRWHRPGLPDALPAGVPTREVAIVGLTRQPLGERRSPPAPPGFRIAQTIDRSTYRMVIARAPVETPLPSGTAAASGVNPADVYVVVDLRH